MSLYSLDAAIALSSAQEGLLHGHFGGSYANMVGPFGGIIAATLLNGVLTDPECLGQPVAMTVNFAGVVADAEFDVTVQLARATRTTQHWVLALNQEGKTVVTATAMTAQRPEASWQATDLVMPEVPAASQVSRLDTRMYPGWAKNYALHIIDGGLQPGSEPSGATTRLWVRDEPPRPLDFLSLMAISDVFFPRVFVRRQQMMPAGTVSMTTYFHADAESLARQGDRALLGVARANRFHRGFFDQSAELWGADGELLVTTHQMVYFKG